MALPYKSCTEETNLEELLWEFFRVNRDDVLAFAKVPQTALDTFPAANPSTVASTFQLCVIKNILITLNREVIFKLRDVCTPTTCPKMIASDEWHFLCAPHADKPRDCCAIDYMQHTVDSCSSTILLIEDKPPAVAAKQFHSIVRRLFRIYGHLYFHHQSFFKFVETECAKFFVFLKQFGLWKGDMVIIPEDVLNKLSGGNLSEVPVKDRRTSWSANRQSLAKAPSIDLRSAGTIVDLRTVAMQLDEEFDEDTASQGSSSNHTVILS
jgi:hypothetical protein